jgi:hypothetical protein
LAPICESVGGISAPASGINRRLWSNRRDYDDLMFDAFIRKPQKEIAAVVA